MSVLHITDDGDEEIYFHLDGKLIMTSNHEEHGWSGMQSLIDAFTKLAEAAGVEVENAQDIV